MPAVLLMLLYLRPQDSDGWRHFFLLWGDTAEVGGVVGTLFPEVRVLLSLYIFSFLLRLPLDGHVDVLKMTQ